jgi:hypothetical protein
MSSYDSDESGIEELDPDEMRIRLWIRLPS